MLLRALATLTTVMLALATVPGGADARPASDWVRTEFADIRLISAVAGTRGLNDLPLGLEFRLAEGWKVYWRSPGDAGYPPRIDWNGSQNLADVKTAYPVPHRFSLFGIETFGYRDAVVYPITVELARPGEPVDLSAAVNALICHEICVPLDARLTLALPADAPLPTAFTQLLERWMSRVPRDLKGVGLAVRTARLSGEAGSARLHLYIQSDRPLTSLDVFPEGPEGISFGKPEIAASPDRLTAAVTVPVGTSGGAGLSDAELRFTLVDGARFVERAVPVERAATALRGEPVERSLVVILGFALLGGLILNLMPCVLPVLSLKLVSAVGYGGADRRAIRLGFLASAAGIMISFLVLAGAVASLKAAGVAVGWGVQFQQPLFLAFMATVVLLFAANLWGWFEIPLPRAVARLGEIPPPESPAHPKASSPGGLTGHFLTGAFAALLATPCSAPFVGTAIGFALSRGGFEIVAVFAALGLGLALPYLAVAALPETARALPRPGPWMVVVKRLLALALVATGIWLLVVLSAQIGAMTAGALAAVFAVAGVILGVARRGGRQLAAPTGAAVLAIGLVLAGLGRPPVGEEPIAGVAGMRAETVTWHGFALADIDLRVAGGEVVLVDVTADWCLTCTVNKRLVLDRAPVADLLADGAVTAVRADWTNPDAAIADYLAGFGRYGIPFNAVYGPGAPQGIVLPELLTSHAVLAAIERARPGRKTAGLDSQANRPM